MHPILIEIGTVKIPSYGAILVLAFLTASFFLRREATRQGLDGQKTTDMALVGLLFGLLGSKLLLILVDLPEYVSNPQLLLGTIRSAGVIYGGQLGGALGVWWYIRRHNLPLWKSFDVMTPFLALGIGLGRLSCLMAGCCFGRPYSGPFALHFPEHPYCDAPAQMGLFPTQILALLNGIALCLLLVTLLRRRSFDGQVTFAFVFLYGLTRTLIEFLRGDEVRGLWLGNTLSTSQVIALFAMGVSATFYILKRKGGRHG